MRKKQITFLFIAIFSYVFGILFFPNILLGVNKYSLENNILLVMYLSPIILLTFPICLFGMGIIALIADALKITTDNNTKDWFYVFVLVVVISFIAIVFLAASAFLFVGYVLQFTTLAITIIFLCLSINSYNKIASTK